MLLPYQAVRIPFPQKKAGFKERGKRRRHIRRRDGTGVRLRGNQARMRRSRDDIYAEALLYRSWSRWLFLHLMWLALGIGAFLVRWVGRGTPWHLGVFLCFVTSFVAAFARNRGVRVAASLLIVVGGALTVGADLQPEVALGVGLAGLGLLLQNSLRL